MTSDAILTNDGGHMSVGCWRAAERLAPPRSVIPHHRPNGRPKNSDKDREQLDETFRYYGKIFPTRPYPSADGMEYALEILKKSRPDARNLKARDYILNRFIDELDKEGFLAQVFRGQ